MKKILLLSIFTIINLLLFSQITWMGNEYTTLTGNQYLGDTVLFEIQSSPINNNQGARVYIDWSNDGYGFTQDVDYFDLNWIENISANRKWNKYILMTEVGTHNRKYVGWEIGQPNYSTYNMGTFTILELVNPVAPDATPVSSSQINLSWDKWNTKDVMIVRSTSSKSWTTPTNGREYSVGDLIGDAEVIYNASSNNFADVTGLAASSTYNYMFYSVNNNYYSSGIETSATTGNTIETALSGNWNTSTTWVNKNIPTTIDDITISHNVYIVNDDGVDAYCHNLEISSGKILTIKDNVEQSISGSVRVLGEARVGNESFLNVANDLSIILNGTVTIEPAGKCTVEGNLVNNSEGTFIIKSDQTGTGSFILNGSITGEITMERYIAAADWLNWKDGWHFISSPVSSYPIQDNFTVTPASDYDFYAWSQSYNMWVNFKEGNNPSFSDVNGSMNFELGHGYMAAYNNEVTKSITGTINTEDITVNGLTVPTGSNYSWYLLGNPFNSGLLWDENWAVSNVAGTIKIWNETAQAYSDIIASTTGVIPATNGFMVQVNNESSSFVIRKDHRTHSSQPFYKNSTFPVIRLKATNLDNISFQESQLLFNPNSSTDYEMKYDSDFLPGHAPLFYSLINGRKVSVNSLPNYTQNSSIPFTFIKNDGLNFSIEAYDIEDMDMDVWLYDKKQDVDFNLTANKVYYFTSFDSDLPDRFVVHFNPLSINDTRKVEQIGIFSYQNNVEIQSTEPIDASINIYNIAGQLITTSELNNNSSATINVPDYRGAAIVSIVTSSQILNKKVIIW